MINQSEEILDYIKEYPGVSTEGIVSGTGWNRHLVEVAVKLMVEQGLIRDRGKDEWGDSIFEADLGHIHHAKAIGTWPLMEKELEVEINNFVDKLNQDLQTSTPGKLFGPSPFEKVAKIVPRWLVMAAISGGTPLNPDFELLITGNFEHERLIDEISVITNLSRGEVRYFYQTHPYSLEFIKAAIQAGAKLDEEDVKRTMEERAKYSFGWSPLPTPVEIALTKLEEQHTFIVTLPNNDRREVKAAYMEVDGSTLYFEDEDHDTILAFGPGHWVWAERKEDDTP